MTTAAAGARLPEGEYLRLAGQVKLLSWLSLVWMTLEGGVAILAGILAGSIALIGFGIDSAIEGFASAIIVWRFTGNRLFSDAAERRAQKLVAIQFFLLAPYVGFESVRALVEGERPETSVLGIALSASSVVIMPYLGIAKQRLADRIGSAATKGEGRQNMLCVPGRRSTRRAARKRAVRRLVARCGGRTADRRCGGEGGPRGMARQGLRLHQRSAGGRGAGCLRRPVLRRVSDRDRRRYWSSAACTARSNAPLPNEPSRRAATLPSASKVNSHGSVRSPKSRSCFRSPFSTELSS